MKIKDTIAAARDLLKKELGPKKTTTTTIGSVEMGITEPPKIIEKRGAEYVLWGEDNLYPNKISELKHCSPIHNAIISTASDLIAGNGFLFNGAKTPEESEAVYNSLDPGTKAGLDQFTKNPYGNQSLVEITKEIALDLKEQGGFSIETVLNTNKDKVATLKYTDIRNIRAGKMVNDKVESYWFTRDWARATYKEHKPREFKSFDPKQTEVDSLNQIIFVKRGKLDYYPEPDYIGALTWIQIDAQMGVFHLANIENGMNPSLWWRFYKKPGSENEQQLVLDELRRNYKGSGKAGKHIVTFSEGKELAPDITPVSVSNLDKQLIVLAELSDKKILTGHKLTSPLLAGISVSGQLGGNQELEKAFQIYDKTRIAPYRAMIAETYQKILDFNKINVKIAINPFNPFV